MKFLGIQKESEINTDGRLHSLSGVTFNKNIKVIVYFRIQDQAIISERLAVATDSNGGEASYYVFETNFTAISPEVLCTGLVNYCETTILPVIEEKGNVNELLKHNWE